MGTLIVDVRKLVIDSLSELDEFTTQGPTGQTVEATFAYRVGSKRRERCWTGNAEFDQQPASIRPTRTHYDEEGAFDLVILIEGVGLSTEVTSGRAVEVGLAVEDWVATHANWEGALPGLISLLVKGRGALAEAFNDKGSLAELTYPIHYQARLT